MVAIGSTGHITPNIPSNEVDLEVMDNYNKNLTNNFVTIEGDQFTINSETFKVKGLNYYPIDRRLFGDEGWNSSEVNYDLELARSLNVNTVRIFINYQQSTNNLNYSKPVNSAYKPDPEYIAQVNEFLNLAQKHNLKVILTLFGQIYWELYSPKNYWICEEYLEDLIPRFVNNSVVMAWDIKNEPDRDFKYCGRENVVNFLRTMSQKIRMLDKNHLVTVGFLSSEYTQDIKDYVDFISFHWYLPASQLGDTIDYIRNETNKPIAVEEFGLHTWPERPGDPHDEEDQARYYRSVLSVMQEKSVAGYLFWTLFDFQVRDKETFDNHMGIFRVDYEPKPSVEVIKQFYNN